MTQPIKGYRDLSADELLLVNAIKTASESLGTLVDNLRLLEGIDQRWVSIGQTDLQTGMSALVRAVTRPTTF